VSANYGAMQKQSGQVSSKEQDISQARKLEREEVMSELGVLSSIKEEYPMFSDITVRDLRDQGTLDERRMEYYSPEDSPTGEEMIDIFDPELQGEELQNAIIGEFLHSAPKRSKEYAELRDVIQSIKTPQQIQDDISRYEYAKENYGEKRPFEKWLDVSGLDAFIRGYAVKQWDSEYYTDEQKLVIDMMMDIVREK